MRSILHKHLSLGFNASTHWHHLRFVNGGRMKGFHETLGAHTFKSVSPTFIHGVSPSHALRAIPSRSMLSSTIPVSNFHFYMHPSTYPPSDTSIVVQYFIKTLCRTYRLTSTGFIVYLILHLIIYRFLYRCAE